MGTQGPLRGPWGTESGPMGGFEILHQGLILASWRVQHGFLLPGSRQGWRKVALRGWILTSGSKQASGYTGPFKARFYFRGVL